MRLVVDASALVLAAIDDSPAGDAGRTLLRGRVRHAPHLVDAEIGSALRRLVLRAEVPEHSAVVARRAAARLVQRRHRQDGVLAERAWQLRHTVTFADGLYVALAEWLACALVTADARLAGASGLRCAVEVLGR